MPNNRITKEICIYSWSNCCNPPGLHFDGTPKLPFEGLEKLCQLYLLFSLSYVSGWELLIINFPSMLLRMRPHYGDLNSSSSFHVHASSLLRQQR